MRSFSFFLVSSFFLVGSANTQELIGIRAEPPEVIAGKPVQIVIEFRSLGVVNGACGLLVNFGDGSSELLRAEENNLPVRITKTYNAGGVFPLSAEGKSFFRGLNSVFGCIGRNQSATLHVRADGAPGKMPTAQHPPPQNTGKQVKPVRPPVENKPNKPGQNIPGTPASSAISNPTPNTTGQPKSPPVTPTPKSKADQPKSKSSLDL